MPACPGAVSRPRLPQLCAASLSSCSAAARESRDTWALGRGYSETPEERREAREEEGGGTGDSVNMGHVQPEGTRVA